MGSRWEVHGSDGAAGPISLRSDPSLCLAAAVHEEPTDVIVAKCVEGDAYQQWQYNATQGTFQHASDGYGASPPFHCTSRLPDDRGDIYLSN